MDRTMVLTDIRNVQRLADWTPDEISGYEIRTRSPRRGRSSSPARSAARSSTTRGKVRKTSPRRASRSGMPTSSTG